MFGALFFIFDLPPHIYYIIIIVLPVAQTFDGLVKSQYFNGIQT